MDISEIVLEICALLRKESQAAGIEFDSEPRGPASESDLARLSRFIGEALDPEYESFLRVCDGWRNAETFWAYLSIDEILGSGRAAEIVQSSIEFQKEYLDERAWMLSSDVVIFDWESLLPIAYEEETACLRVLCIKDQPMKGKVIEFGRNDVVFIGGVREVLMSQLTFLRIESGTEI